MTAILFAAGAGVLVAWVCMGVLVWVRSRPRTLPMRPPVRLRILRVDMDGYCGREHHPSRADEGREVVPLRMELLHGELLEPMLTPDFDRAGIEPALAGVDVHALEVLGFWTCLTDDGRLLELLDHEVAVVPARKEV